MIDLHINYGLRYYLLRGSPVMGLCVIIFSLVLDDATGPMSLWVSGIGIIVGVAVALGGMLYHNMESRVTDNELALRELRKEMLPRSEFEFAHNPVQEQLGRLEVHLANIDNRIIILRKLER